MLRDQLSPKFGSTKNQEDIAALKAFLSRVQTAINTINAIEDRSILDYFSISRLVNKLNSFCETLPTCFDEKRLIFREDWIMGRFEKLLLNLKKAYESISHKDIQFLCGGLIDRTIILLSDLHFIQRIYSDEGRHQICYIPEFDTAINDNITRVRESNRKALQQIEAYQQVIVTQAATLISANHDKLAAVVQTLLNKFNAEIASEKLELDFDLGVVEVGGFDLVQMNCSAIYLSKKIKEVEAYQFNEYLDMQIKEWRDKLQEIIDELNSEDGQRKIVAYYAKKGLQEILDLINQLINPTINQATLYLRVSECKHFLEFARLVQEGVCENIENKLKEQLVAYCKQSVLLSDNSPLNASVNRALENSENILSHFDCYFKRAFIEVFAPDFNERYAEAAALSFFTGLPRDMRSHIGKFLQDGRSPQMLASANRQTYTDTLFHLFPYLCKQREEAVAITFFSRYKLAYDVSLYINGFFGDDARTKKALMLTNKKVYEAAEDIVPAFKKA